MLVTGLCHVRAAFIFDMGFIREPLDIFPQGVHIRILENVDCHDYLIITWKVSGVGFGELVSDPQ